MKMKGSENKNTEQDEDREKQQLLVVLWFSFTYNNDFQVSH